MLYISRVDPTKNTEEGIKWKIVQNLATCQHI